MSEEIAAADALLRESAELRAEVARLRADNAALLRVLYAADRELETLYGGMADHADAPLWNETPRYREIHAVLDQEHPGRALLAELEAVLSVVAAMREIDRHVIGACENDFGDMPEPCEECGDMREIAGQALAAYDKAMKASK